jgi:hypothetical protein
MLRFIFYPLLYPPICLLFQMAYERVLPAMDNFVDAMEIIYLVLLPPALTIAAADKFLKGWWGCAVAGAVGILVPARIVLGLDVEGVLSLGAIGALAALCCRWIFRGATSGGLTG